MILVVRERVQHASLLLSLILSPLPHSLSSPSQIFTHPFILSLLPHSLSSPSRIFTHTPSFSLLSHFFLSLIFSSKKTNLSFKIWVLFVVHLMSFVSSGFFCFKLHMGFKIWYFSSFISRIFSFSLLFRRSRLWNSSRNGDVRG